jgi:hypothetical protein
MPVRSFMARQSLTVYNRSSFSITSRFLMEGSSRSNRFTNRSMLAILLL